MGRVGNGAFAAKPMRLWETIFDEFCVAPASIEKITELWYNCRNGDKKTRAKIRELEGGDSSSIGLPSTLLEGGGDH